MTRDSLLKFSIFLLSSTCSKAEKVSSGSAVRFPFSNWDQQKLLLFSLPRKIIVMPINLVESRFYLDSEPESDSPSSSSPALDSNSRVIDITCLRNSAIFNLLIQPHYLCENRKRFQGILRATSLS